jgi:protein-tyrosine kinase
MSIVEAALARAKQGKKTKTDSQTDFSARRSVVADIPVASTLLDLPVVEVDQTVCVANRLNVTAARDTYSSVSDAYRIIRTRLLQRMDMNNWDSIAVTSAGPDEGKSLTVLNLGSALANERKRNVFLLDLDLRNPSLCQYLGVQPPKSVGEFLSGKCKVEEVFFKVGDENLVIAGGYSRYENSAELLGDARLAELIAHVKTIDPKGIALVDLPPVLSVADALIVAPKVSATLLVVAEGKTNREALANAKHVLGSVTMAGIVLNQSHEAIQNYYS